MAEQVCRDIKAGSKKNILRVLIPEIAAGALTGLGETDIANTSVVVSYARQGEAAETVITDAAGALGVWSSGGWAELDSTNAPGVYEFGIPDAVVAKGAKYVDLFFVGPATAGTVMVHINLARSIAY